MSDGRSPLASILPSLGETTEPAHDLRAGCRGLQPILRCHQCRRTWLPDQDRGLRGPCPGPRHNRTEKRR